MDVNMSENEQAVLNVLSGGDPAYFTTEIATATNLDGDRVIAALWSLNKRGLVVGKQEPGSSGARIWWLINERM